VLYTLTVYHASKEKEPEISYQRNQTLKTLEDYIGFILMSVGPLILKDMLDADIL